MLFVVGSRFDIIGGSRRDVWKVRSESRGDSVQLVLFIDSSFRKME